MCWFLFVCVAGRAFFEMKMDVVWGLKTPKSVGFQLWPATFGSARPFRPASVPPVSVRQSALRKGLERRLRNRIPLVPRLRARWRQPVWRRSLLPHFVCFSARPLSVPRFLSQGPVRIVWGKPLPQKRAVPAICFATHLPTPGFQRIRPARPKQAGTVLLQDLVGGCFGLKLRLCVLFRVCPGHPFPAHFTTGT